MQSSSWLAARWAICQDDRPNRQSFSQLVARGEVTRRRPTRQLAQPHAKHGVVPIIRQWQLAWAAGINWP